MEPGAPQIFQSVRNINEGLEAEIPMSHDRFDVPQAQGDVRRVVHWAVLLAERSWRPENPMCMSKRQEAHDAAIRALESGE